MITETQERSAIQNSFYINGSKIIQVKDVGWFKLTYKDSLFGALKNMTWEQFESYQLLDIENWKEAKTKQTEV